MHSPQQDGDDPKRTIGPAIAMEHRTQRLVFANRRGPLLVVLTGTDLWLIRPSADQFDSALLEAAKQAEPPSGLRIPLEEITKLEYSYGDAKLRIHHHPAQNSDASEEISLANSDDRQAVTTGIIQRAHSNSWATTSVPPKRLETCIGLLMMAAVVGILAWQLYGYAADNAERVAENGNIHVPTGAMSRPRVSSWIYAFVVLGAQLLRPWQILFVGGLIVGLLLLGALGALFDSSTKVSLSRTPLPRQREREAPSA